MKTQRIRIAKESPVYKKNSVSGRKILNKEINPPPIAIKIEIRSNNLSLDLTKGSIAP